MDNNLNVRFVALEEIPKPLFREQKGRPYIKYGMDNAYNKYLMFLYMSSPKNQAIIEGKADYVFGKGWPLEGMDEDDPNRTILERVNTSGESANDVTQKIALDFEIANFAFLQIIWSKDRSAISEIYHIDFNKVRTNEHGTEFYVSHEWVKENADGTWKSNPNAGYDTYPAYDPSNPRGTQILYLKKYTPGMAAYPLPGYIAADNWIEVDVEIAAYHHSNVKGGFFANKIINLNNGIPETPQQEEIEKRFKKKLTGVRSQKFILAFNKNAESATSIEDLGVAESDKIFDLLNKTAGQEIFTAHRVTSPMLFGIRVEGQLGGRSELIDASELFQNTYVNNRQQEIERMFNWIFPKMGVTVPLTLQRTEIITPRFSEATQTQNMSREEIREKMGLPPEEKKGSMQEVINALKALPDSVVNKVLDAMSKDELRALAALTPAVSMSTIHFSAQEEEEAAAVFSRFGVDRAKFRLLLRREARFKSDSDEVAHFAAADDELTNKQVVALDLLNKDPLITPDDLASALNVTLEEIGGILSYLEEAELIKTVKRKDKSGNTVLERKPVQEALRLLKEMKPITRSVEVMYSYEGPKDDRNRPFCAKMLELDRLYSRADIEAISIKLGYSVWARRGGWYTDPKTGSPRPYCRHTWVSNVVVKSS